jgi:surfeit locus 1 family protein
MMRFTRPRPLAIFWFISAFGTTMALGTWQVARLHWKEALVSTIEQAKTHAPLTALPKDEAAFAALDFYPVALSGTWQRDIEYHLAPRFYRGKLGYWVVAPLRLNDGRTVLVNRGWIPTAKKDIATRRDTVVRGYAKVTGLLRTGAERNYFTPKNAVDQNIWFGRDIAEMAAQHALKNVVPAMVDQVGGQDVNHLPVPSDGTIRLRNDHLSYIITWYGIAAGIAVIFLSYHRKK